MIKKSIIMSQLFKVDYVFLDEVNSFVMTDPVTGHYTQLVWANTYEIGCGFISSVKHTGGKVESVS